jgi:hypothetical protein
MSRRRRSRPLPRARPLPKRKRFFDASKPGASRCCSATRFGLPFVEYPRSRLDRSQLRAAASLTPPVPDGSLVQMLQWFRGHARSIAAPALLSLATLSVWSAAPHQDDCHEAICASVVVPHDPSSHSIHRDTSTTAHRPLHCVLCHWTRIVRPSATVAHHLAPAVDRAILILVDVVRAPEAFFAAQPPLRAPPSSPYLDA